MKAIILAAGTGSRLYPYTKDKPKCLVELKGMSLLERQLRVLKGQDINDVTIVAGYLANMLVLPEVKIRTNNRYRTTNMVWTLFCAEKDLVGECIIAYGDIVYSKKILASLLNEDADIAITIDTNWKEYWGARSDNPLDDAETLKLDDEGYVIELGQKPESLEVIEGQFMGLMKFSQLGLISLKSIFDEACKRGDIKGKDIEQAYMTDLLQLMIDSGCKIKAVPISDSWIEVDTVEDLESQIARDRVAQIDNE